MLYDECDRAAAPEFDASAWVSSLSLIARHYGIACSPQSALNRVAWGEGRPDAELLALCARPLGLRVRRLRPADIRLTPARLPVIVCLKDGGPGVLTSLSRDGQAGLIMAGEQDQTSFPLAELLARAEWIVIARPARTLVDARVDDYIAPYREGWLRRLALPDLRPYGYVLIATFTANLLGLTGILFSKQVYDRVVPAESFNTLYVLFIGVLLAAVFDFVMRRTRARIVDSLGKRADIRLSDQVYGHALRVKNAARPKSTGAFVAQLRDLEALRDMLTSTTLSVVADLPFFVLFLAVFWYIGGPLVMVPAAAVVLMILPGLLVQGRLNRHVNESMREGSMRNAMLIESVQGIEDIKSLQAEDRFQQRWNHFNAVTAEATLKQRNITGALQTWSHAVQMGVFATIIFVGAPMVIAGDMTTGTLVACSILGSRMMAPMAQFSQIFSRIQQARLSHQSIDAILRMEVDHPESKSRIGVTALQGDYHLRAAVFYREDAAPQPALTVADLRIRPGEKLAVAGRIGSGKSTLLQALAGMIEPRSGEVLLDDMALAQIDPSDLRRDIGLLSQESRLFHGTIRDNLILGNPQASDGEIMAALKTAGALEFVSRSAQGLDYPLLEEGRGLSGGQRQMLMLARLILRDPRIVILDEPTASMDEQSERSLLASLKSWSADRSLIIATHRMRVLDLVDRVVVTDQGRITFDGDKAAFLLRGQRPRPARPAIVATASGLQAMTAGPASRRAEHGR